MPAAVAGAPDELTGLRVLALEIDPGAAAAPVWPAIDVAALARARRPVTAVVRIDGSRPIAALSLDPLLARLDRWRAAGVNVAGIEIDHDCATSRLAAYAAWLAAARPPAPLGWSITALPTWVDSPALADVASAVDELVVQVHAVRAPRLFDPAEARRWLEAFARRVDQPLRVSLPTYRVAVSGQPLAADPVEIAGFVRQLSEHPIAGLRGVVWFRLPVASDRAAWSAATLRAVIQDRPLAPRISASLVARGGERFDIVVANDGNVDAAWPHLVVRGGVRAADVSAPPRDVRPGERRIVGWATGQEMVIDAM